MISTNKKPIKSFVVAKVGQTSIPTSGTYYNSSTGAVSLNDGQLGLVASSPFGTTAINNFVDATPTIAESPVITFMSGTSTSSSPSTPATFPLWNRPFRASTPVDARGTVIVTKQPYREPEHSVWYIGDAIGNAGAVNVVNEAEYEIAVGFRGRRTVEAFSSEESAYLRASITAPNFTTLGLSTALSVDYLLTYLCWEINRNSQQFAINSRYPNKAPIIAFLISTAGGTGKAIGGGTPIASGDTVTVLTTGGVAKTITVTEAMATSIKDAAVAGAGVAIASVTWTILNADLANAGSATGGTADMLMLMALDQTTVYDDRLPNVKVRLDVSLPQGFNYSTVRYAHGNKPDEGQGLYRQLDLDFKGTQGQREYTQDHNMAPVITFPTPFVSGEKYVTYNIHHGKNTSTGIGSVDRATFCEVICIPAYSSGTTPNALISTFDTVLNNWLASSAHNDAIVTLD